MSSKASILGDDSLLLKYLRAVRESSFAGRRLRGVVAAAPPRPRRSFSREILLRPSPPPRNILVAAAAVCRGGPSPPPRNIRVAAAAAPRPSAEDLRGRTRRPRRYLNPHLLVVVTTSAGGEAAPLLDARLRAAGDDADQTEPPTLHVTLVDTVSATVAHRASVPHGGAPAHAAVSENWVLYASARRRWILLHVVSVRIRSRGGAAMPRLRGGAATPSSRRHRVVSFRRRRRDPALCGLSASRPRRGPSAHRPAAPRSPRNIHVAAAAVPRAVSVASRPWTTRNSTPSPPRPVSSRNVHVAPAAAT